ncbi:hypothetical protein J2TS4_04740 [Paenibacillus sp. J2TS4]|nr:hypothetical protein J2TS4_04740 [Paenibacillus sp. J2TS4]
MLNFVEKTDIFLELKIMDIEVPHGANWTNIKINIPNDYWEKNNGGLPDSINADHHFFVYEPVQNGEY